MPRRLPSGRVTFLFTDVEGSTRLLRELGAVAYAERLGEHRRVVREVCAARAGVEVDTQGDAFFVSFPTAAAALDAARAITDGLASGPIRLRIGLHTGRALVTDEGYVGEDVHVAARVAASAHGGQVVLSQSTRAAVGAPYKLIDLGEHRLQDVPEPISIYQLGDARFPPLKTISNTNLPRPPSSFVGRERELAATLSLIRSGARLVTLSGPGGSGTTRLALEAAATVLPEFKAGVLWVGLAPLRQPALVMETIAQTLGAKANLADHIADRQMLLLLDNFEQVIEAAPELSALLTSCSNLTLLVTSRELLRVQGEVEYVVPPLVEQEAITLFSERAQMPPSEDVAELCRRLDFLPLAVELAAARTKALSPAQILDRLSQRLDLLKGGRGADPRQRTLRATMEWSYELLAANEQQLFARLSVFAGGCTLESAEEVCEAGLDMLQSLVEKSLLRYSGGRFWMLETVRELAAEQHRRSDDAAPRRQRHAEWVHALAAAAEPRLHCAEQVTWLDRIDAERGNIRAALSWSLGGGDIGLGLRLCALLMWFWQLRSYLGEGEAWLSRAVVAAHAHPASLQARLLQGQGQLSFYKGDYDAARRLLGRAIALWRSAGDSRGLVETLVYYGITLGAAGDQAGARAAAEESVILARELADDWVLGLALWPLGEGYAFGKYGAREPERGEPLLEESVELLRRSGDDWALAAPLFYLGLLARDFDNLDCALALVGEAATLLRAAGDKWRLAIVLRNLGLLNAAVGNAEAARQLAEESEQIQLEVGRLRTAASA